MKRIYFQSTSSIDKSAKAILKSLKALKEMKSLPVDVGSIDKLALTKLKTSISKGFGYSSYEELNKLTNNHYPQWENIRYHESEARFDAINASVLLYLSTNGVNTNDVMVAESCRASLLKYFPVVTASDISSGRGKDRKECFLTLDDAANFEQCTPASLKRFMLAKGYMTECGAPTELAKSHDGFVKVYSSPDGGEVVAWDIIAGIKLRAVLGITHWMIPTPERIKETVKEDTVKHSTGEVSRVLEMLHYASQGCPISDNFSDYNSYCPYDDNSCLAIKLIKLALEKGADVAYADYLRNYPEQGLGLLGSQPEVMEECLIALKAAFEAFVDNYTELRYSFELAEPQQ